MILALIKLSRPLNLLIIALTMYGLGWYFDPISFNDIPGINSLPFFLLVFSTVLIAAAGNIINDYFDIKADRVNKPNKLIIGKTINRRYAIITHWSLNFLAFIIGIYLSLRFDTFWYVFIHLSSINILWFYSTTLKRKFLIGNISVAFLTALVPIIIGMYFSGIQTDQRLLSEYPFEKYSFTPFINYIALFTAIFAFILNLSREIIKDIEDIKGDLKINAVTIPIKLGYKKSKWIVSLILLVNIVYTLFLMYQFKAVDLINLIPIFCSITFVIISLIIVNRARTRKSFNTASQLIKFAMVFGILTPVFWAILRQL